MGTKIRLWRIDAEKFSEVDTEEKVRYEKDLHARLEKDLSLISDNLILVSSHVRTDYGTEIDILGMDPNGDLVVIELKRGKTDEEVTAQALDYASWVSDLDYDRVMDIASEHYGGQDKFRAVFKKEFEVEDIPEVLNQSFSIIIVGTALDEKTERVVNFLSEEYGVPINAVLFECFRDGEVAYLARTAVIDVDAGGTRPKTKRAPRLTDDAIDNMVEAKGVRNLYDKAEELALGVFKYRMNMVSAVSFKLRVEENGKSFRRAALLIFLGKSSNEKGLNVLVYGPRLHKYFGLDVEEWAKLHGGKEVEAPWYSGASYDFYLKTEAEIESFFDSMVKKEGKNA